METRGKPLCEFGAKCYRKNPKHLESYYHPQKESDEGTFTAKKITLEANHRNNACKLDDTKKEQAAVGFSNISESKTKTDASVKKNFPIGNDKARGPHKRKRVLDKRKPLTVVSSKRNTKETAPEGGNAAGSHSKKAKFGSCFDTSDGNDSLVENTEGNSDSESVQSKSWIFTKNNTDSSSGLTDLKNKPREEIIKTLFLVDMPPDFYSFYEFCKVSKNNEGIEFGELKPVGPFEVLSGTIDYSKDPDSYLCHWRFYYDPPEFQTVLAAESGYHIGYWRDDPKENPVFVASNSNKDCTIKIEAENLFGAVFHYLDEFKKIGDPFKKVKTTKVQQGLKNWAEKNKFTLEKKTKNINTRQKKIVSKTFHGAGMVVPVQAKTEVGYRPLIETDATLKKICNLIIKANDETEREQLWENLQPLITAANIANDECDFGNGLELGIDLFCMGSPVFHSTVEHLLSTAYTLLNRSEFEQIIRAHLKSRRKDFSLQH